MSRYAGVGGSGASSGSVLGGGGGASGSVAGSSVTGGAVAAAALAEKDQTITELRETVEILELKIKKLEQLVRLKDSRISTLTARLQGTVGGAAGTA